MFTTTHHTNKIGAGDVSTEISRGHRRRTGAAKLVIGILAVGVALCATESASATSYVTNGGGTCRVNGTSATAFTGSAEVPNPTQGTMLVQKWVRLIDYYTGQPQTYWTQVAYATLPPGWRVSFGPNSQTHNINGRSRIQADYVMYVNGAFAGDVIITTTNYTSWVYFPNLGWQGSGTKDNC
jgi:hypothetical protein